ncbi:hypothetical protein PpBr36_01656 [Pyricularia pennisetigena]|uniref:hypothetical protein n=1 Tax=Pyricularia pennisetigena TaxID=1578925 RepID=UPI0011532404|nr:hypothetical protein PpBr36_01656 [Pyricularia pennisetigena]TLS29096.1 hypothetical protein PpBr36_01656 [Pyricularia pennisetigena]
MVASLFDFQRRRRKILDEEEAKGQSCLGRESLRSCDNRDGGPRVVKPVLSETCRAHAVATKDTRTLDCCDDEDAERVKIDIGSGTTRRVFLVHKALLRHYSEYFRGALRGKSALQEAADEEFYFPEVDTDGFMRFVRWLYMCRTCKKGGCRLYESDHRCSGQHSGTDPDGMWCGVKLEHDYALGDWLLCPRYCSFVMSHFVPHVDDSMSPERLRWILANTGADSPMQRFTRHYVCWLKLRWADGKCPADWAQYPDLVELDDGWASTDPRRYQLEHWESECSVPASEANAMCPHRIAESSRTDSGSGSLLNNKITRGLGSAPRKKFWEKYRDPLKASFGLLVLIYHFLFPFAWVGISAFIVVVDDDPLLFEASKYYSLITGCLAVIGIWPICMRMMKMYFAMACSILVVIASVLSFASSSTCLARDDSFISIFRSSKDAVDLVKRAPIRYELVVENTGVNMEGSGDITPVVAPIETMSHGASDTGTSASQQYAELQEDEPSLEQLPSTPNQQQEHGDSSAHLSPFSTVQQRSFMLSAFITNLHAHYTHIRRSRLYGPWEREKHAADTFMSRALRKLVPSDHDTQPFADWITNDQLNEARIEEHDEQQRSGLATTFVETRKARRGHKALLWQNMGNVGQIPVLTDDVDDVDDV